MNTKTLFCRLASAALMTIFIAARAEASFIVNFSQVGNNVVATGSGSINTGAFIYSATTQGGSGIDPSISLLILGTGSTINENKYTDELSGPSNFGSGSISTPSSATGDRVGLSYTLGWFFLPDGYSSGSALSTSDTWSSTTISALGLTAGTYTYNWGAGGDADSLILDIQGSAAPEPGTVGLLSAGALGLVLNRVRRRKSMAHT